MRNGMMHKCHSELMVEDSLDIAISMTQSGFPVLERQDLAPKIHLFRIEAPAIARKAKAGQFVVIRMDERAGIATAVLDLQKLRDFREKFPAWKDADDFSPGW